jgi:hypothetical protein
MWDPHTLARINEKAVDLARQGRPERDAQAAVGITLCGPVVTTGLPAHPVVYPTDDTVQVAA